MSSLHPGDLIDHFRIVRPLDAGAMGDVYLALDVRNFSNVALKVLTRDVAHYERSLRRFHLEAEVYRRIAHPNIVGVVASGSWEDYDYIALEHIRGTSLAHLMQDEGVVDLERCESIMRELVYALNAAHQQNVIHRDIKPQNIMITDEGTVKLIDFGIAKEERVEGGIAAEDEAAQRMAFEGHTTRSKTASTSDGNLVGTPVYASPEQLQCKDIDGRSDIYSLGLVLYELFTGLRLLSGGSPSEILLSATRLAEKIIPPCKIEPRIRPEVEKIILKMVRYDPKERFQSAIEVAEALHAIWMPGAGGDDQSSPGKKTRALARLELSDTYYWKAMSVLDQGQSLEALDLFHKLLLSMAQLPPETMVLNIRRALDGMFITLVPSNALEQEVLAAIGQEGGSKLKTEDFLHGHYHFLDLYDRLDEPIKVRVVVQRLEGLRQQMDEAEWWRDPVQQQWKTIAEHRAYRDTLVLQADSQADYPTNAERYGVQAQRYADNGNVLAQVTTLVDRALVELEAKDLGACRRTSSAILRLHPQCPPALVILAETLRQKGIHVTNRSSYRELCDAILETAGLYDVIVSEIRRGLDGSLEDVAPCQRLLTLCSRAGLDEEVWMAHVHLGRCYLAAGRREEARSSFLHALADDRHRAKAVQEIKQVPNVRRIFSLYELTQMGTTALDED